MNSAYHRDTVSAENPQTLAIFTPMYHGLDLSFGHQGTKTPSEARLAWCLGALAARSSASGSVSVRYSSNRHNPIWYFGALVAMIIVIPFQLSAQTESVAADRVREMPSRSIYEMEAPIAANGYSFLAAGHWYGANENYQSMGPASSLLGAIGKIYEAQPKWIFALGDVVRNSDNAQQVARYQQTIEAFGCETILVPGNHDLLADGSLPASLGTETNCLRAYGDQFIFLNTEKLFQHRGHELLKQLKALPSDCEWGKNLFVFSHRLVWALAEPGFEQMDEFANEPLRDKVDLDTLKMVFDAVGKLAGNRPIHWFSGDIGASWSLPVFEGHSQDGKRHYFAAGLGDTEEDAFWQVQVDEEGKVSTSLFSLAPVDFQRPIYDLEYWKREMASRTAKNEPGFLSRLAGEWKVLCIGVLLGIGLAFLLMRFRRKPR
jgi:hypothetical protein